MRIGVVADTHGLFDPALPDVLRDVECILHAGDIVDDLTLGRLSQIAPVHAVRGNNDRSAALMMLPEFLVLTLSGHEVLVTHDLADPRTVREIYRSHASIVVVGHSHRPMFHQAHHAWIVNPGSAGPKRFKLPRPAGVLTLGADVSEPPRLALVDLDSGQPYTSV